MKQYVVGLISGTSVDGIDAALVEIAGSHLDLKVDLLAGETYPYPESLRSQIHSVCGGAALTMADFAQLDEMIAQEFARAAIAIQQNHPAAELIGSHGQTVFHRPPSHRSLSQRSPSHRSPREGNDPGLGCSPSLGYSLQLGRGALIAHLTGITTISNFRAADIAAGGQGAPLVSPVDVCLLSHPAYHRCVQNIGGIGNVTFLPAIAPNRNQIQPILGWDTGPGNALLDLAVQRLSQGRLTFDQNGNWAAQGTPCQALVQQWLQQDFFGQHPPKSTGRELFGEAYLASCLADAAPHHLAPQDILATLTELTAASIAHSYQTFLPQMPDQVLLCGGGSHNLYLKQRIQANLEQTVVLTTNEAGLNSDFKEAIAFAVLAYWRNRGIPGNLPEVTGAQQSVLLGDIHLVS
ncbi:MAG: anhydro-N-acetylmuramic acid kinase [Drouetiella hepatica Uher 2000/2452]|uniref:Anhydro-N-acetylmuramic acid kinase n=1 Tax=Drouetiella hepatica Uher 2000/2452 TaxID=904376 RepID=A0A951UMH2_9CYAN|nr:anhydro-N-acetylmuramic acid kinase [Drouetiella hepatica Uher 2000/2452]